MHALCRVVISGTSVQSFLQLQKLQMGRFYYLFWPKHGLRSDLKVPDFPGGACLQTPHSLFTLKRMQWSYQSKIAGTGPGHAKYRFTCTHEILAYEMHISKWRSYFSNSYHRLPLTICISGATHM